NRREPGLAGPFVFFFYDYVAHLDIHSFPTRRSSDVEHREDGGGVSRGPDDGRRDRVAMAVEHPSVRLEGVILLETVGSADVERDHAAQVRGPESITGHSRHEQEDDAPGPAQPGSLGGQGASAA